MDQSGSRQGDPPTLDQAERRAALALVRRAVEVCVAEGRHAEPLPDTPCFRIHYGAFVTLSLGGRLRGCIGVVEAVRPLGETLVHCAVAAATEDLRFPPVSPDELPELRYEISILSSLREAASPEEIEVGRHGILIEAGSRRGLLLPQVAGEQGWDRDTFLEHVCQKAGLQPGSWRSGCRLWIFSAEVFREEGFKD